MDSSNKKGGENSRPKLGRGFSLEIQDLEADSLHQQNGSNQ